MARIEKPSSQPPFAALANRKHWVGAPSVRFLQVAQFSLRAQRKSAIHPTCRKWYQKDADFAFAANALNALHSRPSCRLHEGHFRPPYYSDTCRIDVDSF
jgi:hypothetical protein